MKKIKTKKFGEITVGLHLKHHPDESKHYFHFEEELDRVWTKDAIKNNDRYLNFFIRTPKENDLKQLYVYLGSSISTWNDEYAIKFIKSEQDNYIEWQADDTDTRAKNSDVTRIRNSYLNAGYAIFTLCSDKEIPILKQDGSQLSSKIEIDFEPWHKFIHDGIKNDFKVSRYADITNAFYDNIKIAREKSNSSDPLERYYRVIPFLQRFAFLVRSIVHSPHSKILQTNTQVSLTESKMISFTDFMQIDSAKGFFRHNNRFLPKAFIVKEFSRSFSTPENIFVKNAIRLLLIELDKIISAIVEEIKNENYFISTIKHNDKVKENHIERSLAHEIVKNDILKYYNLLKKTYQNIKKNVPVDEKTCSTVITEVFYFDWRYSHLRKIISLIRQTIDFVDTSEDAMPFEVESITKQYEKWCSLKIVDSLLTIGFKPLSKLNFSKLYKNPLPGIVTVSLSHPDFPKTIIDVYSAERFYKSYSQSCSSLHYGFITSKYVPNQPYTDYDGTKHTPDIALEIWTKDRENRFPQAIITFDPTFSKYRDSRKYEYRKSIRNFTKRDSNGHFVSIVKSAWGVFPGDEKYKAVPTFDKDDEYKEGFINLNPSNESISNLQDTLTQILNHTGYFTL